MFSCTKSIGLLGLDGYEVKVETSISPGLSGCEIVGLPDAAVRESRERVLSSIKNIGFDLPYGRVVINLAPANTKKEGAVFDLPIAISLLTAMRVIEPINLNDFAFLGELSLNGNLNSIPGILPMAISAQKFNIPNLIIPYANASEAGILKDINIFYADNITSVISHLCGKSVLPLSYTNTADLFSHNQVYDIDFADVKGQENVKRAFEIAAAGNHNLLLLGSPGSGKTMLSRRLPTILPDLTFDEALEVTKIYSITGLLSKNLSIITKRPFRSPHHTVSSASLAGGGRLPHPGEISLAHNGVLFLDELPEFQKNALEVMRQPLEDREVTVSRVNGSYTYPANFMFIASMNPCPCGYYGSEQGNCKCTPKQIHNYINKISGPLLDRIDLHIEVSAVKYSELGSTRKSENSIEIRERVNSARKIQLARYKSLKIHSNSELTSSMLEKFCPLNDDCKFLLKAAFEKLKMSARAYSRILKVARTIADLADQSNIEQEHIAEAIQYRNLDRRYFNNSDLNVL